MKELQERMDAMGLKAEWTDLIHDLEAVKELSIETDNRMEQPDRCSYAVS